MKILYFLLVLLVFLYFFYNLFSFPSLVDTANSVMSSKNVD